MIRMLLDRFAKWPENKMRVYAMEKRRQALAALTKDQLAAMLKDGEGKS